VTRNTDYTETKPYSTVKSNCWESYTEGVKVFYADTSHQDTATFKTLIEEVKPDMAYINGVYSWKFSIQPLRVCRKAKLDKVIVASRGMLAPSAIDVKGGKKRVFLTLANLAGLYKKVVFHATNKKEEQDIYASIGMGAQVVIADNLPKKQLPMLKAIVKDASVLKLVSLARIAPEKNTLFALERLAELAPFTGQIQFDLYGQIYNADYWAQCQEVFAHLPDNIKVLHKGTVEAEQVGETIQNYHALYMPTRGENFGHVILESLSAGRPVLISDQTPWKGLEKEECGWDVPLEVEEGVRYKGQGAGNDVKGAGRKVQGEGNKVLDWSEALMTLVSMEQDNFDLWCRGARKRAENFVNNEELRKAYEGLLG